MYVFVFRSLAKTFSARFLTCRFLKSPDKFVLEPLARAAVWVKAREHNISKDTNKDVYINLLPKQNLNNPFFIFVLFLFFIFRKTLLFHDI